MPPIRPELTSLFTLVVASGCAGSVQVKDHDGQDTEPVWPTETDTDETDVIHTDTDAMVLHTDTDTDVPHTDDSEPAIEDTDTDTLTIEPTDSDSDSDSDWWSMCDEWYDDCITNGDTGCWWICNG